MEIKKSVSVLTITYGHEAYIAETIESVLSQEVDFSVEMIIADDCSPDNTEEVVKHYIDNHPKGHWIKYTRHAENKGPNANFLWAFERCAGKYIALCEGDDYWTDPLKLQKQVNFMDSNIEYSMCFHNTTVYNQEKKCFEVDNITKDSKKVTSLRDLSFGNYIHTPTVIVRKEFINIPNWFHNCPIGDYPLWSMVAMHGKIYKFSECMSVYRVHSQGAMRHFANEGVEKRIERNKKLAFMFDKLYILTGENGFKDQNIVCSNSVRSYLLRIGESQAAGKVARNNLMKFKFDLSIKIIAANVLTVFFPTLLIYWYGRKG
jgi:glycosyltransferase involved in cell wall biosynthesis